MKLKLLILACAIFAMLSACTNSSSSNNTQVKRAFYEWNSWYHENESDTLLKRLGVQRMYVRFFDVDVHPYHDGYPYPINSMGYRYRDSLELVPTVFITNKTFAELTDSSIEILAHNVEKKIKHIINNIAGGYVMEADNDWWTYEHNPYRGPKNIRGLFVRDSIREVIYNSIPEIQFDCDWSPSTRNNYFLFLKKMKARFADKVISSTIRLYGYKYPEKAGVPPVDKGMLMCYNAGDVTNMETPNSIFYKKEVMAYLDIEKPYPLALDYAFPVFDWCAVYRDGKLIKLMQSNEVSWFSYRTDIFKEKKNIQTGLPMYEVLEEYTLGYDRNAVYLRKGDVLKIEQPDLDDVADVVRKLSKTNTNPAPVISIYEFDHKKVLKNEQAIQKIYSAF